MEYAVRFFKQGKAGSEKEQKPWGCVLVQVPVEGGVAPPRLRSWLRAEAWVCHGDVSTTAGRVLHKHLLPWGQGSLTAQPSPARQCRERLARRRRSKASHRIGGRHKAETLARQDLKRENVI